MLDERVARRAFFERLAPTRERFTARWQSYYEDLHDLLTFLIRPDASVLEIGCGTGAVLRRLPNEHSGIDFSPAMVAASRRHDPRGHYEVGDAEALTQGKTYDVVLLLDLLNSLVDVERAFQKIRTTVCHRDTRVVITFHNFLWKSVLTFAQFLGLKSPSPPQNWLTVGDVETLLQLANFEVVRRGRRFLFPFSFPFLSRFCNRFLVHFPPFSWFAFTHVIVARPVQRERKEYSVSVIVPVRNEAGTIDRILETIPVMGTATEVVFVEGHSRDGTWERVQRACTEYRGPLTVRALKQTGKGKGDAVRAGFAQARHEVLMILDGDLSVDPSELPKFYDAIAEGKGELISGSRLVYPMEGEAMRFLNLVGNKAFSWMLTWIVGQRIKDTLCGTKVLFASHYAQIAAHRGYFGTIDPFGDFDLLFGAAKQSLKMIEIPVRYRQRTYGETNIHRFRHGLLLLRMTALAMLKLKFPPPADSKRECSPLRIVGVYGLLLGLCFFGWPVIAGIPSGLPRIVWVFATLALTLTSFFAAFRLTKNSAPLRFKPLPWGELWPLLVGAVFLLFILSSVSVHSFSDETHIITPALTVFHRMTRVVAWPFLLAAAVFLCIAVRRLPLGRPSFVVGIISAFAGFSLLIGLAAFPAPTILAVRYPPLVHLTQFVTTLLSGGSWTFVRLPNLFWTLLLLPVLWYGTPNWSKWQRYALLGGLLFGPLAWAMRTELYQACGEMTFGLTVVLLLARLLKDEDRGTALLLGITLVLWVLYRPTAVVVLGSVILLFVLLRRFRDALSIAFIALPPVASWLSLYPLYRYDFLLSGQGLFPAAQSSTSFFQSLVVFVGSLSLTLNPIVLVSLLVTTLVILLFGRFEERCLLFAAWLVALPPVLAQQIVLPVALQGYARYDLLLHLPLAVALGILVGFTARRRAGFVLALAVIIALLFVTPWNIESFRQNVRTSSIAEIYRLPTHGEETLPITAEALHMIQRGERPIIIAPDSAFLELPIAAGYLTPKERTSLVDAGSTWTPLSPARPVLVQAPVVTTYQPNLSAAAEDRLKSARAWALSQPDHRIVRFGIEEVVIVP